MKQSLQKNFTRKMTTEIAMVVSGKNPFRRRREFNERLKELNHDLVGIDRYENFRSLSKEDQVRWKLDELAEFEDKKN